MLTFTATRQLTWWMLPQNAWDCCNLFGVPAFSAVCRYVDEDGIVTLKGRVAATIQSSDELVLTELIFNSGFKARLPHALHAGAVRA